MVLEPARVDAHEPAPLMLREGGQAIARDAGGIVDDRAAGAQDPVEERRFADVGPADDGDDR